ncbi:translocator protein, LysE family [Gleimia coleocanis DSM 15436]|uniref:Translocator protein, LysE family n=1 Tax=Gleimia coleocanis DSM 15436 TaxID=525245 RepID=C0VYB6_9ACTO|nr:LysE family transporter [Gleimia coleocanis]EEH64419.1 translocator protein, LysE family [Gleimia coleocanis DSM 15436]
MLTFSTWVAILTAFTVAVISPGPDFLTVLRASLNYGRKNGYATAAGIAFGTSLWIIATMAGLATLLNTYPALGTFTRLGGAALLFYFGLRILWGLYRSVYNPAGSAVSAGESDRPRESADSVAHPNGNSRMPAYRSAWLGFVTTTIGNPKAIIFYSSLFASMLPAQIYFSEGAILGLTMVTISFNWFALVATVASNPKFIAGYERVKHPVDTLLGALFVVLAILLVV